MLNDLKEIKVYILGVIGFATATTGLLVSGSLACFVGQYLGNSAENIVR